RRTAAGHPPAEGPCWVGGRVGGSSSMLPRIGSVTSRGGGYLRRRRSLRPVPDLMVGARGIDHPSELVRPLLPGLIAATDAAVAPGHLGLEQHVGCTGVTEVRDPLSRLDIEHAGVVQAGDSQDRRVLPVLDDVLVR